MQDADERREEAAFRAAPRRTIEGAPVVPAAKARQGVSGARVLTVLVAALALVMVGFAAGYLSAV